MKIVVIGAGIAGLSIGWRLAKAGCEVVLLERGQPARGATWASGGMIAAAAENLETDAPEADLARRSAAMWPDFAAEIERASGKSISYRRDGTLVVAPDAESYAALATRAGDGVVLVSADDARARAPLLRRDIAGALWAPDDAQVDNRAVGLALALAFVAAGGTLQVNEAAVRLEVEDNRIVGARTPFALYAGDAYVVAAGAWSSQIKRSPEDALPPVIPVKGEMIALKASQDGPLPMPLVWGNEVYLIPRHDRVFVGATVGHLGFDTSTTREARSWLHQRATFLMPALADWDIVEQWAGLRPGSPDNLPVLGETKIKGLFIASGQFRNGILFAPAIADALCGLILEHRPSPDLRAFDPQRFVRRGLAGSAGVG